MAGARKRAKQDWDLRPSMKDKPGSQGTLFRAPVSLRKPEARYPRGYTPERYRAVANAVNRSIVLDGERKVQPDPSRKAHTTSRHVLIQNLARSTIPVKDIQDINVWELNSRVAEGGGGRPAYLGKYIHRTKTGRMIRVRAGYEGRPTVIHEMGHKKSEDLDNPHHWETDARSLGHEEGFADNYVYQHYRSPGYKRTRLVPTAEKARKQATGWRNVYGDRGRSVEFQEAYLATRAAQLPELRERRLPAQQLRLF